MHARWAPPPPFPRRERIDFLNARTHGTRRIQSGRTRKCIPQICHPRNRVTDRANPPICGDDGIAAGPCHFLRFNKTQPTSKRYFDEMVSHSSNQHDVNVIRMYKQTHAYTGSVSRKFASFRRRTDKFKSIFR